jgi:hypothetical protein
LTFDKERIKNDTRNSFRPLRNVVANRTDHFHNNFSHYFVEGKSHWERQHFAICNDLFAVYAYLCFLIYNQASSVLYNILSGMVGAMVVFLFKKPNQKDEQKNKPTTT